MVVLSLGEIVDGSGIEKFTSVCFRSIPAYVPGIKLYVRPLRYSKSLFFEG